MYEEAMLSVMTVRDFSQVFDAYAQFEELLLSKQMQDVKLQEKKDLVDDFNLR